MSEQKSGSKVWFITGASSGFGRSLAEQALAQGHRVVAAARKPEALADLAALAPERVLAVRLDVTKGDDIGKAVAEATARFGDVDVLVNNAGYS
ncbi:MAG: SDR family NAD(P)-dependent oxidoreductase, partial [Polyangiaceae bacterium]|nr:SDR family NAD(P)-dependent oxidoreductase [Polyangiaceae bacterium]